MGSGSYAFADLAVDLVFILRLLAALMVALGVCWLAGCALLLTCAKTATAWRRRRERAAYRAEVARGLAEIDRFVRAHAGRTADSGCTDDGTHDEP
jgi:ABC-type protease/lipase transport system fused ATPase/permease subunit